MTWFDRKTNSVGAYIAPSCSSQVSASLLECSLGYHMVFMLCQALLAWGMI